MMLVHNLGVVPGHAMYKWLIGGKRIVLIKLVPDLYARPSSSHRPDLKVSQPVGLWFPFHDADQSLHHLAVFSFDSLIVDLFLDLEPLS